MKHRKIIAWILFILLGILYGMAALGKLSGAAAEMFTGWGYPAWFMLSIGVLEGIGAIGLLIPATTRWAVYGLTVVMIGALYTHVAHGEGWAVLRPLIFLAVLWTALWLRRSTAQSGVQAAAQAA